MSKYIKGLYKVTVDEEKFNRTIDLKHTLQNIAGMYQNDMVITEKDLEFTEKSIRKLYITLMSDFEDLVSVLAEDSSDDI